MGELTRFPEGQQVQAETIGLHSKSYEDDIPLLSAPAESNSPDTRPAPSSLDQGRRP